MLSNDEIFEYVNQLDKESRAIRRDSLKLSWFMRGGATYDDIMAMSFAERKLISEIAKDNIEQSKKSGMPLL